MRVCLYILEWGKEPNQPYFWLYDLCCSCEIISVEVVGVSAAVWDSHLERGSRVYCWTLLYTDGHLGQRSEHRGSESEALQNICFSVFFPPSIWVRTCVCVAGGGSLCKKMFDWRGKQSWKRFVRPLHFTLNTFNDHCSQTHRHTHTRPLVLIRLDPHTPRDNGLL